MILQVHGVGPAKNGFLKFETQNHKTLAGSPLTSNTINVIKYEHISDRHKNFQESNVPIGKATAKFHND